MDGICKNTQKYTSGFDNEKTDKNYFYPTFHGETPRKPADVHE